MPARNSFDFISLMENENGIDGFGDCGSGNGPPTFTLLPFSPLKYVLGDHMISPVKEINTSMMTLYPSKLHFSTPLSKSLHSLCGLGEEEIGSEREN